MDKNTLEIYNKIVYLFSLRLPLRESSNKDLYDEYSKNPELRNYINSFCKCNNIEITEPFKELVGDKEFYTIYAFSKTGQSTMFDFTKTKEEESLAKFIAIYVASILGPTINSSTVECEKLIDNINHIIPALEVSNKNLSNFETDYSINVVNICTIYTKLKAERVEGTEYTAFDVFIEKIFKKLENEGFIIRKESNQKIKTMNKSAFISRKPKLSAYMSCLENDSRYEEKIEGIRIAKMTNKIED